MKKILLLLLTFMPLCLYAGLYDEDPIFGKYGFANQSDIASYQQYVGKTVIYLPCEPLNYAESNVFKTQKFIPEGEYVITDISPKTGYSYSTSKITITFQEKGGKKKLKMKAYADWAYEYPFFFIDDFNADKEKLIGKSFADPLVKGEYKVDNVSLEKNPKSNRIKEVLYQVSNSELNRTFTTNDLSKTVEEYLREDKGGKYISTLVKVEKPKNASERYGEVKTVEEKGVTKYSFEDELIDIIIFGGSSQFIFKLTNKSQSSIKVVWDDAVFVDYTGSTSKVMHSGIKYSQREASQPASTIIRGASLEDIACPTSNVRYSDVLKEWVTDSMYPKSVGKDPQQIRLMLPIQIKDVVNEYVFIFDVNYIYNHPERLK